ncbi:hypothetical protein D3C81_342720 [compost metagenome]
MLTDTALRNLKPKPKDKAFDRDRMYARSRLSVPTRKLRLWGCCRKPGTPS